MKKVERRSKFLLHLEDDVAPTLEISMLSHVVLVAIAIAECCLEDDGERKG